MLIFEHKTTATLFVLLRIHSWEMLIQSRLSSVAKVWVSRFTVQKFLKPCIFSGYRKNSYMNQSETQWGGYEAQSRGAGH